MKRTFVGVNEAKAHFAKYVRLVANGETKVVIASGGRPLVKLVAYTLPSTVRKPGLLKGKVVIKPGFDDVLPGFDGIADLA